MHGRVVEFGVDGVVIAFVVDGIAFPKLADDFPRLDQAFGTFLPFRPHPNGGLFV